MMNKEKIPGGSLDLWVIAAFAAIVYFLSGTYDILEALVDFSRTHEAMELDELLPTSAVLCFGLLFIVARRWHGMRKMEKILKARNRSLETAAKRIQTLEGILAMCSGCKKIRTESGKWEHVDTYVEAHSKAVFSHSMCPDCMEAYYGDADWFKKNPE